MTTHPGMHFFSNRDKGFDAHSIFFSLTLIFSSLVDSVQHSDQRPGYMYEPFFFVSQRFKKKEKKKCNVTMLSMPEWC